MRKNGLLTVLFSFVPGAGQMYQGYMKRGLSQITAFVVFIMIGAMLFEPIAIFSAVVYMYSFFDSLNLREAIRNGIAPRDDFQFDIGKFEGVAELVFKRHNIVGWGLILVGAYGLYDNVIYPWIWNLADIFGYNNVIVNSVRSIIGDLPTLMVSIVFVVIGIRLIRGSKPEKSRGSDEDYTEFKGE